jgi:translation initiation factor IF-2
MNTRSFDSLTEREILALAVTLEEEDARIYADFAEGLREHYPGSADVFLGMRQEEIVHRERLFKLFTERFGDHVPLLRREDIRGFLKRRPLWLMRPLGLSEVARPGDILEVVDNENLARAMAARRSQEAREVETIAPVRPVSLDDVFAQIQAGKVKELNLILKANVQGSIEPIQTSLEKLGTGDLKVKMIHVGTGNVTESDVSLAVASKAIIIAFSVDADSAARRLAEQEGIDIRFYNIIYKLIEDVDKALKGMLEPVYQDVVVGRAEVRQLFHIPKKGTIAGSMVLDGKIARNAKVRVMRSGEKLFDGRLSSLKRFQEDVNEVASGFECGINLEGFNDLQAGDLLEFFKTERVS